MNADLKYPAFAGCQPAIQRTASPRHAPGGVAPIGNRLYRGVALRQRAELPKRDEETENLLREVVKA